MAHDTLQKFIFDGLPVRGAIVRLTHGWQDSLRRRAAVGAFAPPVRALLGEMTAAGLLLQSSIKFEGALVLQIHGDGPVRLAVAEVRSDLSFRATANVTADIPGDATLPQLVNTQGRGRCAITLDADSRPRGTQPYQGVVPLHGDDREPLQAFSQIIEHYMLQSEQLDTRMLLAADDHCAAGLVVQRMPLAGAGNLAGGRDEDLIGLSEDFKRIAMLAATITRDELLTLDSTQVLRRLFWQESVRTFDAQPVRFQCACGRERVRHMLIGLGREEIESIVVERDVVEIGCDFCGEQYRFDAVDVAEMFARDNPPLPRSPTLQ